MSSTQPIWAKGGVQLDAEVQRFCAADDVVCDRAFFLDDIRATGAHVGGLLRIGVLRDDEHALLQGLLLELADEFRAGTFVLDERFEDGHSAIEAFLVGKAGEVGKKVHTARSRNDQVLIAQRLWVKARMDALVHACLSIVDTALVQADATSSTVMPGYTHLQRAMPSTLGAWYAGIAELFLDNAQAAGAARDLVDASPLGTGSGFGVNVALDRDGVAAALQMPRLVVSPLAAQTGRGKLELFALQALHLAALDVRRIAWDLSLYSTAEFAFVKLPDAYTTGSSLMPNKRNPDVVELLRTLPGAVEGALAEVQSLLALPTSYHRDLQATKAPLVRAFPRVLAGLALVPPLLQRIVFDDARMRAAITGDMHATDRAIELTMAGMPFREAYKQAAADMPMLQSRSPDDSVRARVSVGGTAALGLDRLRARMTSLQAPNP